MYSATEINVFKLNGLIGWTAYSSFESLSRTADRSGLISQGNIRGLNGNLYELTHNAAIRVLQNAGYNQEQIDESLSERKVYVFELNAKSGNGTPYLVGEMANGLLTVTAAVFNLSYFTQQDQGFNYYFEVERDIQVEGKLGQFENYSLTSVEHPLRSQYKSEIESQEGEWHDVQENENESRTGTLERKESVAARVKYAEALKQTYFDMVSPYFGNKFVDQ